MPAGRAARLLLRGGLVAWLTAAGWASGAENRPNPAPPLGNLTLRDVTGATQRPLADDGQKATLLFFLVHDCPVANGYAPEINRIVADYAARKIRCFIVYVESDLTAEQARAHVKDYGFKCGALLDPGHRLVKATGATVSPEAAVLSPAGELLYRGRIDDRVVDLGKQRVQASRRDLRLALDALLAGKPVPVRLTRAVGCNIPDDAPAKSGRENAAP